MHYYQFNIGDYYSHTSHLEPLEDIAYRRMIDFCYLNEIPLPNDIEEISILIRMRSHCDCIAVVLRRYFTRVDDGYINQRIESDLAKYHEKSDKAKKSAEVRWNKKPNDNAGLADANALRTDCERNANHKPITNNHKPITIDNTPVAKTPPCPHLEIIDLYHEILPTMQSVTKSRWAGSSSEKDLQARWKEDPKHQSLDFWRRFFTAIKQIDWYFDGNGSGDFKNWSANLKWLIKRKNFDNTIDRLRSIKN